MCQNNTSDPEILRANGAIKNLVCNSWMTSVRVCVHVLLFLFSSEHL